MFDSQFGCNLKLKGAMSLYFRVFRGNLYLITSGKLENGKVEFQFYLLIKLSLHKKQDDSVRPEYESEAGTFRIRVDGQIRFE